MIKESENNETRSINNEHRMTRMESDILLILQNHLPHIQARADKVDKKLSWLIGLVIAVAITGRIDIQTVLSLFK